MWNWTFFEEMLPDLLRGLKVTVEATIVGTMIALALGLALALVRRSAPAPAQMLLVTCTEFVRRTPLLIQLYFVFYVGPTVGVTLSPFVCGAACLGVHYATYASETYRGGIDSIPQGQWDAVRALSLPVTTAWRRVLTPQAVVPVLPALGNLMIAMFKESALLSTITVLDLMTEARRAGSRTFSYVEPITTAALLYLTVSLLAGVGVHLLDRKLRTRHA